MADLLIRGVPEHVVHAIDANARRAGVSRAEYLRRLLARAAGRSTAVDLGELVRLGELTADLVDPSVIDDAWS